MFWGKGDGRETRCSTRSSKKHYNDKYAIGLYKCSEDVDGDDGLVGHVPIKISSHLHHFLNADSNNFINAVVNGKHKRLIGLVVPARYIDFTKNKHCAKILDKELTKQKELFKTLDLGQNVFIGCFRFFRMN